MASTNVIPLGQSEPTEICRLIDQGKDRGYLTYDEINDGTGQDDSESAPSDELLEIFAQEGIEVIQQMTSPREFPIPIVMDDLPNSPLVKEPILRTEEEFIAVDGLPLDDSVRMWLREIGKIPFSLSNKRSSSPSASSVNLKSRAKRNALKTPSPERTCALWSL